MWRGNNYVAEEDGFGVVRTDERRKVEVCDILAQHH